MVEGKRVLGVLMRQNRHRLFAIPKFNTLHA